MDTPEVSEEPPASSQGLLSYGRIEDYRLTSTVAPPPRPRGPLSGETTLTQSASLSLKYEVSLAPRSASRLVCCVPELAVLKPGNWKITQEPLSSSDSLRGRVGLSVVTLISVPARTLEPPTMIG